MSKRCGPVGSASLFGYPFIPPQTAGPGTRFSRPVWMRSVFSMAPLIVIGQLMLGPASMGVDVPPAPPDPAAPAAPPAPPAPPVPVTGVSSPASVAPAAPPLASVPPLPPARPPPPAVPALPSFRLLFDDSPPHPAPIATAATIASARLLI